MLTRTLQAFPYQATTIEVLSPGTQTTIQDWPGRCGYWAVGVPPSGPMDALSFRLANRIAGNREGTAGLEITLSGPTLLFNATAVIVLAGATLDAALDGVPVPYYCPVTVKSGQVLKLGSVAGAGSRTYLAIRGGLDVPQYLGSRSTFTLGKFGGHGGRALLPGDMLHIGMEAVAPPASNIDPSLHPSIGHAWEIGVLCGPHGAPDFFTPDDIETFFASDWQVHYNSNRTGVRLIGPRPKWARADGGEAGLHPSNIHDNAYAIGAIDFTGDMPVILGPDGPSLGGFVCPATVVQAELWKLGQLRPGDTVRFKRLTRAEAEAQRLKQVAEIEALHHIPSPELALPDDERSTDCIAGWRDAAGNRPQVVYRHAGDANLLIEYGPIVLDLALRFRIHALMTELSARKVPGIIDLTPGIRSLQVHYDASILKLSALLGILAEIEDSIGDLDDVTVPSRIVHLPLSWDDAAVQKTIDKYIQSVRADAPWCPSNIEFIRRINGLDSIEDVKRIVFDASYLVLGLGDVYLGAPVATPVDPRHRLVTTKYNPARTWTPDNVVGIGGAYMCIYGMEGPGGYQLFGRTCQVWNTYRTTPVFEPGMPWLLRFFDQIRFYPVTSDELAEFRDGFLQGRVAITVENTTFSFKDYRTFIEKNADDIRLFKTRQQHSFEEERGRWQACDQEGSSADPLPAEDNTRDIELALGTTAVLSPVPGSIWKINVAPGQRVSAGDTLVIVESMKMEMAVTALEAGVVREVRCSEGRPVSLGQTLIVLARDAQEAAA